MSAKNNCNIKEIFTFAASEYAQENFGSEVTIDNIENLHSSNANNTENEKSFTPAIELNAQPIIGGTKQKKSGCC